MKTKFNYNSKQKQQLLKLALRGLKNKIDLLPDVSSMYHEKLDDKGKFQKYEHILNDEIDILETTKFDGYIFMLSDIINYARQSNIFGKRGQATLILKIKHFIRCSPKYRISQGTRSFLRASIEAISCLLFFQALLEPFSFV